MTQNNRRIVRPQSHSPQEPEVSTDVGPAPTFDVEELLNKGGELLRREIANLLGESSRGKLSAASARDLVAYIRLLSELKEAQAAELADLPDAELRRVSE